MQGDRVKVVLLDYIESNAYNGGSLIKQLHTFYVDFPYEKDEKEHEDYQRFLETIRGECQGFPDLVYIEKDWCLQVKVDVVMFPRSRIHEILIEENIELAKE